jgi:hypothetical protein
MSLDLMPHQKDGVAWLVRRPRAMLAWDMHIGKTATALRAWEEVAHEGPALVLCHRTDTHRAGFMALNRRHLRGDVALGVVHKDYRI